MRVLEKREREVVAKEDGASAARETKLTFVRTPTLLLPLLTIAFEPPSLESRLSFGRSAFAIAVAEEDSWAFKRTVEIRCSLIEDVRVWKPIMRRFRVFPCEYKFVLVVIDFDLRNPEIVWNPWYDSIGDGNQ